MKDQTTLYAYNPTINIIASVVQRNTALVKLTVNEMELGMS